MIPGYVVQTQNVVTAGHNSSNQFQVICNKKEVIFVRMLIYLFSVYDWFFFSFFLISFLEKMPLETDSLVKNLINCLFIWLLGEKTYLVIRFGTILCEYDINRIFF